MKKNPLRFFLKHIMNPIIFLTLALFTFSIDSSSNEVLCTESPPSGSKKRNLALIQPSDGDDENQNLPTPPVVSSAGFIGTEFSKTYAEAKQLFDNAEEVMRKLKLMEIELKVKFGDLQNPVYLVGMESFKIHETNIKEQLDIIKKWFLNIAWMNPKNNSLAAKNLYDQIVSANDILTGNFENLITLCTKLLVCDPTESLEEFSAALENPESSEDYDEISKGMRVDVEDFIHREHQMIWNPQSAMENPQIQIQNEIQEDHTTQKEEFNEEYYENLFRGLENGDPADEMVLNI